MKKSILLISIFSLLAFYTYEGFSEAEIALKGLDPVALTQGKEVLGLDKIFVIRGRYKYLFANDENKAKFEKHPIKYAIQMGGACGRMGPLSGVGDPERFYVHDSRIYIFASESCRNNFKAEPENHIDATDALPIGSNADKNYGRNLVVLALKGIGSGEKVDAVKNFRTTIVQKYKVEERMEDYVIRKTFVLLDKFRTDYIWHNGMGVDAVTSEAGFIIDSKGPRSMEKSVHEYAIRQFFREPLILLKARNEPGFHAVAAGNGKVGETGVEFVKVAMKGATSTLAIDPNSGRILSIAYRGRLGGPIGDIVKTFSDFREVDGLILPFTSKIDFNGEEQEKQTKTFESIAINTEVDPAQFIIPE